MAELKNELGKVILTSDIIKSIIKKAVMDCYGLVRMVPVNGKEGFTGFWRKGDNARGVDISFDDNNELSIRIYIIIQYGINIPQLAQKIKEQVSYEVVETTGFHVKDIEISVEGLHVN